MSKSENTKNQESLSEEASAASLDRVVEFRETAEEFLMIKGPVSLVAPKPVKASKKAAKPQVENEPGDEIPAEAEPPASEAQTPDVATTEETPAVAESPSDALPDPVKPETAEPATSLEAASAAFKAMAENGAEAPPPPAAPTVEAVTPPETDEAGAPVPTGLIREIVEEGDAEEVVPDPVTPVPVDEIPDSPVVLAEQDRWSELRTPLVDEGAIGSDNEDFDEAYEEDAPAPSAPTPIERVRAREMNSAFPATPVLDPAGTRADYVEPTFDGPESTLGKTSRVAPAPVPPKPSLRATPKLAEINDREWDNPSDHEMSGKGKLLWRMAVYGSLLAGPIYLVLVSHFPPLMAAKHYASASGCIVADYFELAGAQPGQPGYFAHLDHNKNGIACEATARASQKRKVTFIRPGDF